MSGGGTRAHFARSDSNNSSYDTSSVQILLDTETHKKSKHLKVVIGVGVAVTCFVFLLCIILLSSKSDTNEKLLKRNNTLTGSNSSSPQKTSNNALNDNKEKRYKCYHWTNNDQDSMNEGGWSVENERKTCEGHSFIFSKGDDKKAPGCGKCWCCQLDTLLEQANVKDTANNVTLDQKVKDLTSKSDKILPQLNLLVDNHAESDMAQERKVKELGDKSDDILDQLKKLVEDLKHTSNQISNLDSTIEAHQGEFGDLNSKVDEIHSKITSLLGNTNGTQRLKNDVFEDGISENKSQPINTTKLELMHREIQDLRNSVTLMQTQFGRIHEKMNSIMYCIENNTVYLPVDDINGQPRSVVKDAESCQKRCASTNGCSYFSFWHDGGCHLSSSSATKENCATTNICGKGVSGGPKECQRLSAGSVKENAKMQLMEQEIRELQNAIALINTAACPQSHPYAYYSGEKCCQFNIEKNSGVGAEEECDGGPISINSTCCRKDLFISCEVGKHCVNHDSLEQNQETSFCPTSHPYAYLNGDYCCKTGFENDNNVDEGQGCDGGPISLFSVCCKNHLFYRCPRGMKCSNSHSVKTEGLVRLPVSRATSLNPHLKHALENLIDNNINTFYANNGTDTDNPWVQIQLMSAEVVHVVKITNRLNCCWDRLADIQVRVGYNEVTAANEGGLTSNKLCGTFAGPGAKGEVVYIKCSSPIKGKYVTIQTMDMTIKRMNIAEVELFGTIPAPTLVSDGWCLDAKGDDQRNGSLSIPGSYEPNECFKKCLDVSYGAKVTGCESHEGGECTYHTNPVSGGSGDADTTCWILKDPTPGLDGWCVDENGEDQNEGTITIPGHFPSPRSCFNACIHQTHGKKITGCEYHIHGGCGYHTNFVSGGSGAKDYTCWTMNNAPSCPQSNPYAYYNGGEKCCQTNVENNNSQPADGCDGKTISLNSTCCQNDAYISCPNAMQCVNHSIQIEEEDSVVFAGEGYCANFYELNTHDTAQSCLESATVNPNCNMNDLVISFGKGIRSERCLCNCVQNCKTHTHHPNETVVNPSCTLVGSVLGIDGFDSYTDTKGHKYTHVGKGSCWNNQGRHPPYEFGTSDNSKPETCYEHCMKIAAARGRRCTGFDVRPKCVYYFDEEITRNKVASFPGAPACFKVTERKPPNNINGVNDTGSDLPIVQNSTHAIITKIKPSANVNVANNTESSQAIVQNDTNMTSLGVTYEKTSVGFLCSDAQDEIESAEKCKHAAKSLGLHWGNSWNGPNDFPACLHAEDGRDKVYYNLSPGLRTNLNPKYSAVCKAKDQYQFRHRGHCAAGWDNGPNTNQTTIIDCRNVCAGRANVGYFAYGSDNNCACYLSNSGCPDDNLHDDHNAYRILRQDCDRPASGCSANYDIYWTGDCDGDGANDHVCSTTINNNVWVVLSSNGCGNWNKTSAADCPAAFKSGQVSDGISKVGQQGQPRKQIQLPVPSATTKSMSGCSFKKFGIKLVASYEGNNIASRSHVSTLQSCKDICNVKSDCHSFAYCPFDSSCHAKDRVLSGSEATSSHGGCTTYFRACS